MNNKISQSEANMLLNLLKHTLKNNIIFPSKGCSEDFEVAGNDTKDIFIIDIYRGKKNPLKSYYCARVKYNNVVLLELHIGQTNVHYNPDGTKIIGEHWHIYVEGYDNRTAFPAEKITADQFIENTVKFLDKFNVIKKPEISFQEEL